MARPDDRRPPFRACDALYRIGLDCYALLEQRALLAGLGPAWLLTASARVVAGFVEAWVREWCPADEVEAMLTEPEVREPVVVGAEDYAAQIVMLGGEVL